MRWFSLLVIAGLAGCAGEGSLAVVERDAEVIDASVDAGFVWVDSGVSALDSGALDSGALDSGAGAPDLGSAVSDPSLPGPYAAGVTTVELYDAARDRRFSVEIWYPAEPDGSSNEYAITSAHGVS